MDYDFTDFTTEQLRNCIINNDRTIATATENYNKLIERGIEERTAKMIMPRTTLWEWTDQAEQELKRREAAREPSNAL
jgi:hypothetical protein